MARGLGFSGAARVGGAALAVVGGSDDPTADLAAERSRVLATAARLERHGDNAAASVFGGVVAWVDGRVIPLRVGPRLAGASVVVWIPDVTTSTDSSRGSLPEVVSRRDAVHNLGRMAQFVAAIEHDDPSLLDGATDDRLHQTTRLADVPGAAAALVAGTRRRRLVWLVVGQRADGCVPRGQRRGGRCRGGAARQRAREAPAHRRHTALHLVTQLG